MIQCTCKKEKGNNLQQRKERDNQMLNKIEEAKLALKDREVMLDVLHDLCRYIENNIEIYSPTEETEWSKRYREAWETVYKHIGKLI